MTAGSEASFSQWGAIAYKSSFLYLFIPLGYNDNLAIEDDVPIIVCCAIITLSCSGLCRESLCPLVQG